MKLCDSPARRDDGSQAYALSALCDALAGPAYTAERLAHATEIVRRATQLRNPALELLGRRVRLVALLEKGDRAAAEAEITAYRLRAEAFGHPLYTWYIPLWRQHGHSPKAGMTSVKRSTSSPKVKARTPAVTTRCC